MKKKLLINLMLFTCVNVFAQTPTVWEYNFGTQAATFDIGGAAYSTSGTAKSGTVTSSTTSEQNLPIPYTGQTVRLRAGSAMAGGFSLVTSGSNFSGGGGGARLSMTATNAGNVNKFSIYNIGEGDVSRPATDLFSLSFNIKFVSGTVGTYQLVIGNGTTLPSGGSNLASTDEVFTALRWVLKDEAAPPHTFSSRVGTGSTYTTISSSNFITGSENNMQIFCNNSSTTKSYTKSASTYNVDPNKFHLWIGGAQILNGSDANFSSAGMTSGTLFNSLMLVGNNNTSGAAATVIIDDVRYANYLINPTTVNPVVLPVNLTEFKGKKLLNGIELNWTTASEQNNSHFNILHSTDGRNFETIAKISGNNNSNTLRNYTYTDYNAINGTNYYQLQQVDYDGKTESFEVIAIALNNHISPLQVYALPSQQKLNLSFYMNNSGRGNILIYNLNGSKLTDSSHSFKKGYNIITIPFDAPEAIYSLQVQNESELKNIKFLFR